MTGAFSPSIIFEPQYRRFSPELTGLLMRIERALGVISGARVLPVAADQLRASARVGTVHYSTLIEGNELAALDAERATRGELAADTRAKIELVNYVAALEAIEAQVVVGGVALTTKFLRGLHGLLMKGLGREGDEHFAPRHEGAWRDGRAVVVDRITGQIMHEAPPAAEVAPRMESMFEWLARTLAAGDQPPYVLAAVMHYGITDVHPFADGNGRAARLFQAAVLMQQGVCSGGLFSFERYYAEDKMAYYEALRSVRRRTFNMEVWLEYCLRGLAEEYERVASTVEELGQFIAGNRVEAVQLTRSQEVGLTKLHLGGLRSFSAVEYRQAAGVSIAKARRELKTLVEYGMLASKREGPAFTYRFVGAAGAVKPGRPVRWTDWEIEQLLREFLVGRSTWPQYHEFTAAGLQALYLAASRSGGIKRWRNLLGY